MIFKVVCKLLTNTGITDVPSDDMLDSKEAYNAMAMKRKR
jgi:hypothetical protein